MWVESQENTPFRSFDFTRSAKYICDVAVHTYLKRARASASGREKKRRTERDRKIQTEERKSEKMGKRRFVINYGIN